MKDKFPLLPKLQIFIIFLIRAGNASHPLPPYPPHQENHCPIPMLYFGHNTKTLQPRTPFECF